MQARVLGSNVEVQIYTRAGIIVENEITKTNIIIMTFGRNYWSDLEFSNH